MTELESLVESIAAALVLELPGLHPSVSDRVAQVAARVAVENQSLVAAATAVPTPPWARRPGLRVVEDLDTI